MVVLAYRIGARLRELDSFQYHPTGVAYPLHTAGGLISEAARSAGAKLINGEGERFVDELQPRDVVASAILRECAEGRGIERDGQLGVFLDTPTLEKREPGHPREAPRDAAPSRAQVRSGCCGGAVSRVSDAALPERRRRDRQERRHERRRAALCVGELAGGIHGRNRLMGNALLDILSMGRHAGAKAAQAAGAPITNRAGIGHVHAWQRELTLAGLPLHIQAPQLFPRYANFDLHGDAARRSSAASRGQWHPMSAPAGPARQT